MKKIKDYLYLYIGCECIRTDTNHILKLVGVREYGDFYEPNDKCVIFEAAEWKWADVERLIKPILRPLSDMSEKEAREFIVDVMHMKDYFGFKPFNYKIEKGFLTVESSHSGTSTYVIIKNWGKDGTGEWIFNSSYSMNDIVWLLKRKFDLFGLIEAGIAIDKTKL